MVVGSSNGCYLLAKCWQSVGKVNTDLGKLATRSCRRSAAANGREDNNVCPLNDSVEDTVLVVTRDNIYRS